jgi:hypothetical protein
VARTVRERGYVAPVVLDADGSVTSTYGVHGTPTTFVVGKDGGLVARAVGPRPWTGPEGRALFEALLKEPASPGR